MASGKPSLTVVLSPAANDDLWEIWGDNVQQYKNAGHADAYLEFLRTGINRLATEYEDGKPIEGFPEFQYITLKRSRRGHGHYVIFKVDRAQQLVKVLRIYHTRMDVQGRLTAEFE